MQTNTRFNMNRQRVDFSQRMSTRSQTGSPFNPADLSASLILDFANNVYGVQAFGGNNPGVSSFGALVTFTRASSAWCFDGTGAIVGVGSNTPRFDYDPVTHVRRGLLIEEARTRVNLVSLAPTIAENITVTAQAYTISFYGTGTVVLSGVVSATINGSGAFPIRTVLTGTLTAGTLTSTPSGNVQDLQIEAGAFPTTIIRGEGSAQTRAADTASVNTVSPWFNSAQGTLYGQYLQNSYIPDPTYKGFVGTFTPVNPGSYAGLNGTAGNQTGWYSNGLASTRPSVGVLNKQCLGYTAAGTAFASVSNGGTVFSSAASDFTGTGVTALGIGQQAGSSFLNGTIASIKYFGTQLTNANMQVLTT